MPLDSEIGRTIRNDDEDSTPGGPKLIGFLPWVWLSAPVSVGGFEFVPFLDKSGNVAASLVGLKISLPRILSSYCDTQERPRQTCVVVLDQSAQKLEEAWNLSESRTDAVRWASSLLFLSSWAANEYFTPVGSYVNDSSFQLFFQRFAEPIDFVSLSYRRRDGLILYGGPKHGEIHFAMPLQCSDSFQVETDFLAGLEGADENRSPVVESLKTVLPLIRLANTDSDAMTHDAELALMGFAFEQYFGITGKSKADALATEFDELFGSYGSTDVQTAQIVRSGIRCTKKQLSWRVAKFWIWELYQYRSAIVHGGLSPRRKWGWLPLEHLVMAAFVFPLVVKLRLARASLYSLSLDDQAGCRAVDALLSQADWRHETGSSMRTKWQDTLRSIKKQAKLSAAVKRAEADLAARGIVSPS